MKLKQVTSGSDTGAAVPDVCDVVGELFCGRSETRRVRVLLQVWPNQRNVLVVVGRKRRVLQACSFVPEP